MKHCEVQIGHGKNDYCENVVIVQVKGKKLSWVCLQHLRMSDNYPVVQVVAGFAANPELVSAGIHKRPVNWRAFDYFERQTDGTN